MRELSHRDYLGAINGRIADIGLSVVYEPDCPAIVEYVNRLPVHRIRGLSRVQANYGNQRSVCPRPAGPSLQDLGIVESAEVSAV